MSDLTRSMDAAIAQMQYARTLAGPPTIKVTAGATLQPIIDRAPDGSSIVMEDAIYQGSIIVKPSISLETTHVLPNRRISPAECTVSIVGSPGTDAVTVLGNDVSMLGIGVLTPESTHALVAVTGARFTFDRCVGIGSLTNGQHRGLMLNGDTAIVRGSYISECWRVGQDAQAICGWDGTKHITIDDCYLAGGGMAVMFGGADSLSSSRVPTDIKITRSILTKNPAWYAKSAQIKNALELKCADGFVMQDCVLEYAGVSESQGGYLIVLKSANQGNKAPWTVVQNVLIERVTARYGGGCVSLVGQDGSNPAVKMNHVRIQNVAFTDIDPTGITGGRGWGFQWSSAPESVSIQNCTVQHKNMSADMYFENPPPPKMVLQNIKGMLPKTSYYGVKIDGGGSGFAAVQAWAPDALINVTALDTGATGNP